MQKKRPQMLQFPAKGPLDQTNFGWALATLKYEAIKSHGKILNLKRDLFFANGFHSSSHFNFIENGELQDREREKRPRLLISLLSAF